VKNKVASGKPKNSEDLVSEDEEVGGRKRVNESGTRYSEAHGRGASVRGKTRDFDDVLGNRYSDDESSDSSVIHGKRVLILGANSSQLSKEGNSEGNEPRIKPKIPPIHLTDYQFTRYEERSLGLFHNTKKSMTLLPCIKCGKKESRKDAKDNSWRSRIQIRCLAYGCGATISGINANKWVLSGGNLRNRPRR